MRKLQLLLSITSLVILTGCLEERYGDVENVGDQNWQIMESQVKVTDPAIWNTLATQSITPEDTVVETRGVELRAKKYYKEYPSSKTYYYALFEDLYPSKGDYDFNDVVIKSKMYLSTSKGTATGYFDSELINRGGSLPLEVGLMFYEESKGTYTRIANKDIKINGSTITGSEPWSFMLSDTNWRIDFEFEYDKSLWVSYFIKTSSGEIMTSGMAPSNVNEFELPHKAYLTDTNLPWGLEIEAGEFAIVNEKVLFTDAYPEFKEWINSGGSSKYKKWYENPDPKLTGDPK